MNLYPDFIPYIEQHAAGFIGRESVLRRLDGWLKDPAAAPICWLYGPPGSGKTALASHLWRISLAEADTPAGMEYLKPGFLQACYFCHQSRPLWQDPWIFAQTLSSQLQAIPEFRRALEAQTTPERHYTVNQQVGTVQDSGQVIGMSIKIEGQAQEVFNLGVLEPLCALYQGGYSEPIVILIDGLDDSLVYPGRPTIAGLLAHMEGALPQLRWVIVSSRNAHLRSMLRRAFPVNLSDRAFAEENHRDLVAYIERRIYTEPILGRQVYELDPDERMTLPGQIINASDGLYYYVSTFLDSVVAGLWSLTDLDELPQGVQNLCVDLLDRITGQDRQEWRRRYAPLLGILMVALENLSLAQLEFMTGVNKRQLHEGLQDLFLFLSDYSRPGEGEAEYSLSYRTLLKLLDDTQVRADGGWLPNPYYLPPTEWHQRIVHAYAGEKPNWAKLNWQQVDDYGVLHLVVHAAEAGELRGIHAIYHRKYLDRKRQVLGSEIPLMNEVMDIVLPKAGADEVLSLVYNLLYELRSNSYRAVRTLSAAAGKTRQLPELRRQLADSSQPLAEILLLLAGKRPASLAKWRRLKISIEKDSNRTVKERQHDLAVLYLAWGLSGQPALQADLLDALSAHTTAEEARFPNLHPLAWYAVEGLRELGADQASPETVKDLVQRLSSPVALGRSTSLYILSRWGLPKPEVARAILSGLETKRSARLAAIAADAARLMRGRLPGMLTDDQAVAALTGVLRRGAAKGGLVVYRAKDPWNYPRRRALTALIDYAPPDPRLLGMLEDARSQFTNAPEDDPYARGMARLLEVAIQRIQAAIHQPNEKSN